MFVYYARESIVTKRADINGEYRKLNGKELIEVWRSDELDM
jgi:hypothetical protein